jgi:hypothetical protein
VGLNKVKNPHLEDVALICPQRGFMVPALVGLFGEME